MANAKISLLDYLREFKQSPRSIGSFAESGTQLSTAMASAAHVKPDEIVVEFGPGTGVITAQLLAQGVLPSQLLLIEFNAKFAANLRMRFPHLNILQGDAWQIEKIMAEHFPGQKCSAIVSSLPLLNFPKAQRALLMAAVDRVLDPVHGRFVQFSYGLKSPIELGDKFTQSRSKWIVKNVPPARVWLYKRQIAA